jgi:hypothetical protein
MASLAIRAPFNDDSNGETKELLNRSHLAVPRSRIVSCNTRDFVLMIGGKENQQANVKGITTASIHVIVDDVHFLVLNS